MSVGCDCVGIEPRSYPAGRTRSRGRRRRRPAPGSLAGGGGEPAVGSASLRAIHANKIPIFDRMNNFSRPHIFKHNFEVLKTSRRKHQIVC